MQRHLIHAHNKVQNAEHKINGNTDSQVFFIRREPTRRRPSG